VVGVWIVVVLDGFAGVDYRSDDHSHDCSPNAQEIEEGKYIDEGGVDDVGKKKKQPAVLVICEEGNYNLEISLKPAGESEEVDEMDNDDCQDREGMLAGSYHGQLPVLDPLFLDLDTVGVN
jgi:hypothetical protein